MYAGWNGHICMYMFQRPCTAHLPCAAKLVELMQASVMVEERDTTGREVECSVPHPNFNEDDDNDVATYS